MEKEKESVEKKEERKGLSPKQKEIIFTVAVLLVAMAVGFFIGKWLYFALNK